MKYYIVSGENSGDLYGSYLIDSIRKIDKDSTFVGEVRIWNLRMFIWLEI